MSNVQKGRLIEAGYSRLMQVISGLVPSVDQFGIITWENPQSKELSAEENNRRNEKLEQLLKDGNYSYRQIEGKFGTPEHPFFVYHISKDKVKELGKMGNQSSVIHGKIKNFEGDYHGTEFHYIGLTPEESDAKRYVWFRKGEEHPDFYSKYKGRKFYIPFFDSEYKDAKFKGGEITGKIKSEHNVFTEDQFKPEHRERLIEVTNAYMKYYNRVGSGAWGNRGFMFDKLRRLIK